jgi:hypothetical protein
MAMRALITQNIVNLGGFCICQILLTTQTNDEKRNSRKMISSRTAESNAITTLFHVSRLASAVKRNRISGKTDNKRKRIVAKMTVPNPAPINEARPSSCSRLLPKEPVLITKPFNPVFFEKNNPIPTITASMTTEIKKYVNLRGRGNAKNNAMLPSPIKTLDDTQG